MNENALHKPRGSCGLPLDFTRYTLNQYLFDYYLFTKAVWVAAPLHWIALECAGIHFIMCTYFGGTLK